MEDVLKVYSRPRDEKRPLECLDEMCKQLIADVRDPQPALPGLAARVDYEYERRGMCSAFMVYAPLEKWHGVRVTDSALRNTGHRPSSGCVTKFIRRPRRSCWCRTTLNTHTPTSPYEAFTPEDAMRLKEPLSGTTPPSTEAG